MVETFHPCGCEGACGCSMRPVSADPCALNLKRVHSTWSPASYTLRALDVYFDQLERGGKRRQGTPKMSRAGGLSLSVSISVDNLKDIL